MKLKPCTSEACPFGKRQLRCLHCSVRFSTPIPTSLRCTVWVLFTFCDQCYRHSNLWCFAGLVDAVLPTMGVSEPRTGALCSSVHASHDSLKTLIIHLVHSTRLTVHCMCVSDAMTLQVVVLRLVLWSDLMHSSLT